MTYKPPKDTIELDDDSNEVRMCGNCGTPVEPGTKHLKDEEGCRAVKETAAKRLAALSRAVEACLEDSQTDGVCTVCHEDVQEGPGVCSPTCPMGQLAWAMGAYQ